MFYLSLLIVTFGKINFSNYFSVITTSYVLNVYIRKHYH